jgi:hypothetical protein
LAAPAESGFAVAVVSVTGAVVDPAAGAVTAGLSTGFTSEASPPLLQLTRAAIAKTEKIFFMNSFFELFKINLFEVYTHINKR